MISSPRFPGRRFSTGVHRASSDAANIDETGAGVDQLHLAAD
jgi:hypothetical protein